MTQVLASYRSVEANFTSVQVSAQQQSLAAYTKTKSSPSEVLSKQENQLVDDVSISQQAIKKFEEARRLADQLDAYLRYLKGSNERDLPRIKQTDEEPKAVIAGRSTNLSASITAGSIREETLEIAAEFDDDGNVNALTVTKTQTTVEFVRAEIILEDRQFYAAIS